MSERQKSAASVVIPAVVSALVTFGAVWFTVGMRHEAAIAATEARVTTMLSWMERIEKKIDRLMEKSQ